MVKVIRIAAVIAAVAFLSALLLRDLSIVQFSDAYLLPCIAVVGTLSYAFPAAKAWRAMRKRPGFHKGRWLVLAVSAPVMLFFLPWAALFLLLMLRAPLDTSVVVTIGLLLLGGALSIYNLVRWHKQARTLSISR
jgi:hypothetical protein